MALSKDKVDNETVLKPTKWNSRHIRNFMIVFGIESSIFDLLTFAVLLYVFNAQAELFQTSWFIESVVTEIIILMIIRTQRPFFKSAPGKYLIWISLLIVTITCALPYLPFHESLGFVSLPFKVISAMVAITIAYSITTELTKTLFFKKLKW